MTDQVVRISNLSRQFGNVKALDNVSFCASQGKVYGLVGSNGAGKTTLIKHILGLLRARSGDVEVFGLNPVQHPEQVLVDIGYLSENRELPDWMSIDQLMRYTKAFYPNWDQSYADELLDTFGLTPDKKIKDLSRGMRAQTALIAAVAHKPKLLLLDEPSSGLDAIVRKDILNAVVRTISEEGRTVIFSSHLLEEVERLSDHVVMIQQGHIVLDDSLEQVNETHHLSSVRFDEPHDALPAMEGVLSSDGEGRLWTITHSLSAAELGNRLAPHKGEIIESRNATLEEIFVARAGRILIEEIAA